ncbi:MAG: acyltransferase family protein [Bacteroidales bacterium]|nr:acyltransferase family protein [Bacteroidales bacterium]
MLQRNIHLDYLKFALSILVVAIHVPIAQNATVSYFIQDSLPRLAVPVFYIVNGYFLPNMLNGQAKLVRLMKRLLLLYAVWMVIYLPFYFDRFKVSWLFTGYHHLWYVAALMEAIMLLWLLKKVLKSERSILIIGLALFFTGWAIQMLRILDCPVPYANVVYVNSFTRNFLFLSFPYIAIGYFLRHAQLEKRWPACWLQSRLLYMPRLVPCLWQRLLFAII